MRGWPDGCEAGERLPSRFARAPHGGRPARARCQQSCPRQRRACPSNGAEEYVAVQVPAETFETMVRSGAALGRAAGRRDPHSGTRMSFAALPPTAGGRLVSARRPGCARDSRDSRCSSPLATRRPCESSPLRRRATTRRLRSPERALAMSSPNIVSLVPRLNAGSLTWLSGDGTISRRCGRSSRTRRASARVAPAPSSGARIGRSSCARTRTPTTSTCSPAAACCWHASLLPWQGPTDGRWEPSVRGLASVLAELSHELGDRETRQRAAEQALEVSNTVARWRCARRYAARAGRHGRARGRDGPDGLRRRQRRRRRAGGARGNTRAAGGRVCTGSQTTIRPAATTARPVAAVYRPPQLLSVVWGSCTTRAVQ